MDSISLILLSVQTAAVIAAVWYAACAIKENRAIVRQNNTITLLINELDRNHPNQQGLNILRDVDASNEEDIAIYAYKNLREDRQEKAAEIRSLLNYYENVAIAVKTDIYDLDIITTSKKTLILKIFQHAKPFIYQIRETEGNQKLYAEFEQFTHKLK